MDGERFERMMYIAPFVCVGLLWLSTPVSAFLVVFGVPVTLLLMFSGRPTPKRARSEGGWESGYRIE